MAIYHASVNYFARMRYWRRTRGAARSVPTSRALAVSDDDAGTRHPPRRHQFPCIFNQVIWRRELMGDERQLSVVVFERHLPETGLVLADM